MKKIRVENISDMILDFFLKQNKEDIRVALKPGETSWCDFESSTKSMILYERKNLIKIFADIESTIKESVNINNDEILDKLHTTENAGIITIESPILQNTPDLVEFLNKDIQDNIVEIDSKENEIQGPKKEYKGKKRGRKKKRGPKPGSKRNKGGNTATEI